MSNTVIVSYDGHVLHPETPLDLETNIRYRVTITPLEAGSTRDAWDVLDELAGTVEAPPDWSSEHDHYLYGVPKRALGENRNS
ncbi:MAG: hypothetical protein H0X37_12320 [Herpetosiphonaceae bacterium]|nr:hypothetical protein [Herpetosiphonaceae bacterium]